MNGMFQNDLGVGLVLWVLCSYQRKVSEWLESRSCSVGAVWLSTEGFRMA